MNEDQLIINEKEINYNILKQIQEHAKKYESVDDKKNFLKNVCAYEQKLILLESQNPCEVLMYLDELDSKCSRLVLNELTYIEILEILELFSTEDKQLFYKTFSDLDLVNQFIKIDKNASNIIKDLSFERKIEIMDSSTPKTAEASSKVYESMTTYEKQAATELIIEQEAVNALNMTTTYEEDIETLKSIELDEEEANIKPENEEANEKDKNEKINNQDINEFIKNNLEKYKEMYPELKNIQNSDGNIYNLLPVELKSIIDKEYKESDAQEKQVEKPEKDSENFVNDDTSSDSQTDSETQEEIEKESGITVESQNLNILSPEENKGVNTINNESKVEFFEKYSIIDNGISRASIVFNPSISKKFNQAKKVSEQSELNKIIQANNEKLLETDAKTM